MNFYGELEVRFVNKINITGVNVSVVTIDEAEEAIVSMVNGLNDRLHHVVTPNPEMVIEAKQNFQFKNVLNQADLAIPDGIGLQMAAEFLAKPLPNLPVLREIVLIIWGLVIGFKRRFTVLPERVAGSDLTVRLIQDHPNWRYYFLGGEEGVARRAAEKVRKLVPLVQIVGVDSGGNVDRLGRGASDEQTISSINAAQTDVLLVGFGAPRQDLWIANHRNRLEVRVAIGVGGTLDYLAGRQWRSPNMFRLLGLEWCWRLISQPKRYRRIFNAIIVFPLSIARAKLSMIE